MAKGKHAAALFEVIHSNKKSEPAAGALRTPKWWFKSRPAIRRVPSAQPEVVTAEYPPTLTPEPEPATAPFESQGSRGRFSQARNELNLRMRFSTLVVSGFAVLMALGIAYVLGKHATEGPQTASAGTDVVETTRHTPVTPGALNVPHRNVRTNAGGSTVVPQRHFDAPKVIATPANAKNIEPEPQIDLTGPRVIGRNYIIVMTFPPERKAEAQKACDLLNQHGVPCTIEKAPAQVIDPHRNYLAVISSRGFDHTSDPTCTAYVRKVEAIGRSIRDYQSLMLFKWR